MWQHDETLKFFISRPEIAYGKHRNVLGLFFLKIFFKLAINSQIRYGPTVKNTYNLVTHNLS